MEAAIRLYLDENLSTRIAEQLQRRGVDAVSVRDLERLGDEDANHLRRANHMSRVLFTTDVDFLCMATADFQHSGIVFGIQEEHTIGDWVNKLELLCFFYKPYDMKNHVEYL